VAIYCKNGIPNDEFDVFRSRVGKSDSAACSNVNSRRPGLALRRHDAERVSDRTFNAWPSKLMVTSELGLHQVSASSVF
jgi:hypothetical protein